MVQKKCNEAIRKSIHIGSLIIPLTYRYILSYNRLLMFILLLVSLVSIVIVELYRLHIASFRKFFHKLFGQIMRRHEKMDFTGATFLVLSSMLCVVFFKPIIAFLAISYLSIGDTFAALIGIPFGKRKFINQNKSVEGSLACFTSILLFSILFSGDLSPWVYVIGCFTATLAELWIIPLDDNIKIPLLSGIIMTLVNVIV
jgi:diacylglycerol kinase (CTP)